MLDNNKLKPGDSSVKNVWKMYWKEYSVVVDNQLMTSGYVGF